MYDHPIVKAATKLHVEIELPKALQNPVFIAALFLAKRDQLLEADVERLALIQFMVQQGQHAADRISLDKVRLDCGKWRITLFKDTAPLEEWRIEVTDGIMAGVVRCQPGKRPTLNRYVIADELAPDDPTAVLP